MTVPGVFTDKRTGTERRSAFREAWAQLQMDRTRAEQLIAELDALVARWQRRATALQGEWGYLTYQESYTERARELADELAKHRLFLTEHRGRPMILGHLADDGFIDRVCTVLEEEAGQPRRTWWLSFADPDRPEGEQFLGAVIVDDCPGLATARVWMARHGVKSPGGEIRAIGFDLGDGPPDQIAALARLPRMTVLSLADLRAAGLEVGHP